MPESQVPVGEAADYTGHLPRREPLRGRYTVAYPDTPPLDQYHQPTFVEVAPSRRTHELG